MVCPSGGIGRHAGLRNQCLWREGSSPFSGTMKSKRQYEDSWWMIENAFKCFLVSLIFYLIFTIVS